LALPLALVCLAAPARARGPAPLGHALARVWPRLSPESRIVAWVDLVDREARPDAPPAALLTERCRRRRLRVMAPDQVTDAMDLPVDPVHVAAVAAEVGRVRERSRWFHAVSVEATRTQIEAVRLLPCVRSVDLVARSRHRPDGGDPARAGRRQPDSIAGPGYGMSADQLRLIRVDALHDRALYGLGVLVAHFDTGYQRLSHEVFRVLRVAAAYDFVDHDSDPTDASNPGDTLEHGQYTLSVLGGFKPGKLVGVAPGATFLLARTESSASEEPAEEDHWIAALEWADSLGADIVSSSLKFLEYDMPWTGYTWEDMDGQTARVTRATDVAARRGILVVNGAGNEGGDPYHNTLVAPADGRSVLAVGAVTLDGARARFSSVGPTTDPLARIKPDVMAPGVDVVAADVQHDSAYTRVSGTSLACPLAAGVAALLLSVHEVTPAQLLDVLRQTSSQAGSPDTWMGWGTLDALAAYQRLYSLFPSDTSVPAARFDGPRFANPCRGMAPIAYTIGQDGFVTLRLYDVYGRRVRELVRARQPARTHVVLWDGSDDGGRTLPNGVYLVELRADGGASGPAGKLVLAR
jgi:hypothetical protein